MKLPTLKWAYLGHGRKAATAFLPEAYRFLVMTFSWSQVPRSLSMVEDLMLHPIEWRPECSTKSINLDVRRLLVGREKQDVEREPFGKEGLEESLRHGGHVN